MSARECWRANQIKKKQEEQETGRVSPHMMVHDFYVMFFILDIHLLVILSLSPHLLSFIFSIRSSSTFLYITLSFRLLFSSSLLCSYLLSSSLLCSSLLSSPLFSPVLLYPLLSSSLLSSAFLFSPLLFSPLLFSPLLFSPLLFSPLTTPFLSVLPHSVLHYDNHYHFSCIVRSKGS